MLCMHTPVLGQRDKARRGRQERLPLPQANTASLDSLLDTCTCANVFTNPLKFPTCFQVLRRELLINFSGYDSI